MTKEVKHEFFGKVLTEKLKELKANTGMTQEQFAESVGVQTPNSVTDWKKGYSKPKKETLKKICEILKCDISDFSPKAYSDLYKYDLPFVTKVGKDRSQFAEEIGFDMRLLSVLRKLVNFEEEFPIYSNIVQTNNKEFIRNPNFLDSQTIQEEELKGLQVQHDGRTITLHNADLMFLKEVQDQVAQYVKFLFYERSKEMENEISNINEDYLREYVTVLVNGDPVPGDKKKEYLKSNTLAYSNAEEFEKALSKARKNAGEDVSITYKPFDEEFMLKHDRFRITNNRKDGTDNG